MAKLGLLRFAALGALLSVLVMQVAFAQQRFTREVNFDIAAQSVEAALIEFSKQAGVQVMVGGALNGQKSEGVKGKLSVTQALQLLLKNTGLEYQAEGNTVTIRSVRNARADAKVRPLVEGLQLASSDAAGEAAARNRTDDLGARAPEVGILAEVTVIGSNIRGASPTSPTLNLTAKDIETTGFATMQDWVETLPQNFGAVPNEETGGLGNFARGTGINLRGLGSGATLILVNGRRQPVSGTEGDFVDVSSIPAGAIERVEVLTDGASALYGSDAIGGVVNYVLRKSFNGVAARARYAAAEKGANETVAGLSGGLAWDTGHAFLNYQFYDRSSLAYADRSFTANPDKRAFGGDDFRSPNSNPANILVRGLPQFAIPPGQDGTNLTPADLLPGVANLQIASEGATLLPERTMHSVFAALDQDVGDSVELFVEGRFSQREISYEGLASASTLVVPPSNAFFVHPQGLPVPVILGYSFIDDFGTNPATAKIDTGMATVGAKVQLGNSWIATLSGAAGDEKLEYRGTLVDFAKLGVALADPNPATAFNPFGDGSHTNPATLAAIETTQNEHSDSEIRNVNLIADGSAFALPGGDVKVAIGADYREEALELSSGGPTRDYDRNVTAAFSELSVPLFGPGNRVRGVRSLMLSAAGRYERYSDFGDTFNPKFSLGYEPFNHMAVRASWGTSFRAPRLLDLDVHSPSTNQAAILPVRDPLSPTGRSNVMFRIGGNEDLSEETATTWTAGLDFRFTDFEASLSYYDIEYRDRIVRPGPAAFTDILFQESLWSSVINRSPTPEQIAAACNDPLFVGDRAACIAAPPAAIVDLRQSNLSSTQTRGLDLLLDKQFPLGESTLGLSLNATYVLDFEIAATKDSALVDVTDTINNPVSKRLRAGVYWNWRGFNANVSLNHVDGYKDNSRDVVRSVDAWNTTDVRLSYTTPKSEFLWANTELALTASNIFDKEPPFVNRATGYDSTNASPLGRFLGFQLTKTW